MSDKQSSARRMEEDAVLAGTQNLVGVSVTLTEIVKVVREETKSLPSLAGDDKRVRLKDLTTLLVQLGKVVAVTADSLNRVMAAGRLNTGQAGAITEHRHTGVVGTVDLTDPEAVAERDRRMAHLLDMHVRRAQYVPGTYMGEERGIIDVESTPVEAEPTTPVSVALVPTAPPLPTREDSEAKLRRALAERGMPAAQIDRVIERANRQAAQLARDLSFIVDEILAAPPGQAN